jgi:DNA-binding beta-propeller fold protein YncE
MGQGGRGFAAAFCACAFALVLATPAGAAFGELFYESCDTGRDGHPNCTETPTAAANGFNTGLKSASDVVVSPDGDHVYAISGNDAAVTRFDRDPDDGSLTFAECVTGNLGATPACASTGTNATADSNNSGLQGLDAVALSPNGESLYVASGGDDAIALFDRETTPGANFGDLTFVSCVTGDTAAAPPCTAVAGATAGGNGSGVEGMSDLAATNNGVYAAVDEDDAVARLRRDETSLLAASFQCITGDSSLPSCGDTTEAQAGGDNSGMDDPSAIAISPDGGSVYITSFDDHAIVRFDRGALGVLAYGDCMSGETATVTNGCDDNGFAASNGIDSGLSQPTDIAVSPDDVSVYVALTGDSGVAHLDRDTSDGTLAFAGCVTGEASVANCVAVPDPGTFGANSGLDDASALALPPDGRSLHVAAPFDSSLASMSRDPATGDLTYLSCVSGETDVGEACVQTASAAAAGANSGLDDVGSQGTIAASPDGKSVYAAAFPDDAVAHLNRENPPDTQIDDEPPPDTNDPTPSFDFSVPDPGDPTTAAFECSVDGAVFDDCTSSAPPTSGSHTTAPLDEGPHTFEARAVDSFGFADAVPATSSFTVDTVEPDTSIDDGPPDGATIADASPSFAFSSNEAAADLHCRFDSQPFQQCDGTFAPATALADGVHTFEVKASDAATNEDPSPATRSFTVDTANPDTMITAGPPDGATIADASPSFAFSSNEAGAAMQCRVDGGPFGPCSGGSFTPPAPLSDGDHVFEVRALDAAGNADPTPAVRSFRIDTDAPETSVVSGPKKKVKKKKAKFEFAADEPGSSFECSLDGEPFSLCDIAATFKVKRGKHTLEVRAIDATGNTDATPAEHGWKVRRKK